jgi:hypothetical protein
MVSPFKTEFDPEDRVTRRRWIEALEELGVENLRIQLAQNGGGSESALFVIAGEEAVTRGFAETWLNHQERRARSNKIFWIWTIIIVALVSAIAGCIAAVPVIRGWL